MAFLWCRDKIIESREPFNYQKSAKNEIRGSLQHAYMSKYIKHETCNMKIFITYLYILFNLNEGEFYTYRIEPYSIVLFIINNLIICIIIIKLVVRTGFMACFSSIWKLQFFLPIKNTLHTISPFWLMVIEYVA